MSPLLLSRTRASPPPVLLLNVALAQCENVARHVAEAAANRKGGRKPGLTWGHLQRRNQRVMDPIVSLSPG